MSFLPKYQPTFTPPPYQFRLYDIWREGFKAAKPVWIQLLFANYFFIAIFTSPEWMPALAKFLPFLNAFRVDPSHYEKSAELLQAANLSIFLMPLLFKLFVSVPVYLGLHLMALRIVYQQPAPFTLLGHYFRFRWYSVIVATFMIIVFFAIPVIYFASFLLSHYQHLQTQLYAGFGLILIVVALAACFCCWSINLIFMAGLQVMDGFKLSIKVVRQFFWPTAGMLLILLLIRKASASSYFLSDLVLMPPAYMAWAILYKQIFGDRGLTE